MVAQSGKGSITKSNAMAHARTSLDGRDARQESQHGAFLATGLGLEGLRIGIKCLEWFRLECCQNEEMRHEDVVSMNTWKNKQAWRWITWNG